MGFSRNIYTSYLKLFNFQILNNKLFIMKKIIHLYLFLSLILGIKCGHILVIQCVPTGSYSNIMEAIINTLASEHNITVLSMSNDNLKHPNVTLIKLKLPNFNYMKGFENIFENAMKSDYANEEAENCLLGLTTNYVKEVLAYDAFQNLLKTKTKYNAMLTFTSLTEYVFKFAYVLDIPLVQIASTFPTAWQNEAIGNPNYLSTDNNLIISDDSDTFYNRLIKYIKNIKLILRYKYIYMPQMEQATKAYFPPNVPSIEEISKNTSLLIANIHHTMDFPRPALPNLIEIGGLHCKEAAVLPNNLKEFINGANETGLIYVSFGSTIKNQFPKKLLKSFINVFQKIPQRVIWKINDHITGLPNNVKAMKWFPQQDILGHNNTKLFISQGGALSLQESLYHRVPVLVMPLAFDQPTNARVAEKMGYGRYFRFTNFSEETFLEEINEILSNKKYENKAIEISSILREDRRQNSEKLKWWLNYLIRYNGNPVYRSKDEPYHWARWVEVDIMLFLMFFIVISLLVVKAVIKLFMRNNVSYAKEKNI